MGDGTGAGSRPTPLAVETRRINHLHCANKEDNMAPKSQGLNPSSASYLEACWPVNQVEIQVVQLQVAERLLAGSFHHALVVERAPQLEPAKIYLIPTGQMPLPSWEPRSSKAEDTPPLLITLTLAVAGELPVHIGDPNFPKEMWDGQAKGTLQRPNKA